MDSNPAGQKSTDPSGFSSLTFTPDLLIFQVICASDESEDEVSGPVHRQNDDSANNILDSDSEDVGDSDNEEVTDEVESDEESGGQNDGSGYVISEDGEESNDESVLVQRKKVGVL